MTRKGLLENVCYPRSTRLGNSLTLSEVFQEAISVYLSDWFLTVSIGHQSQNNLIEAFHGHLLKSQTITHIRNMCNYGDTRKSDFSISITNFEKLYWSIHKIRLNCYFGYAAAELPGITFEYME
jgi:hypothetical protein